MKRKQKPARLVVEYRPRKNRVVVLYLGRVVCECRDYECAQSFINGWRAEEQKNGII